MEVADRHYRPLVNGLRVNLSILTACILSEPYFGGIAGAYSFHRSGCDRRRSGCLLFESRVRTMLRHGFR
jgi:hypothetical protein